MLCDQCAQRKSSRSSSNARTQVTKAGGEVDELMTKARQLETGLDLTTERLGIATLQLEGKGKAAGRQRAGVTALNGGGCRPAGRGGLW